MTGTTVFYVSHASLLIRHGDRYVLTDPWYATPAFVSWVPCPPPSINPDVLIGLARAGRLTVVISHAHPDHADPEFLKRLPPETPVVIPRYKDSHFVDFCGAMGLKQVDEIDDAGLQRDGVGFHRYLSHLTDYDSAISLEFDDFFLFHGNDFWRLGETEAARLRAVKPAGKPSLFCGQGGSASGHPLSYLSYSEDQRMALLDQKNAMMVGGVSELGEALGFDAVLPYACLTRVLVPGKDYAHQSPPPTAAHCREITGRDNFLDLMPGDIYLPAEDRVIPLMRTLDIDQGLYPTIASAAPDFAPSDPQWSADDKEKGAALVEAWNEFVGRANGAGANGTDIRQNVDFTLRVVGHGDEALCSYPMSSPDQAEAKIVYNVTLPVFRGLIDRSINFESLETGYLAAVERHPENWFDQHFYNLVSAFGYDFQYAAQPK